jgi:hypothetical protein
MPIDDMDSEASYIDMTDRVQHRLDEYDSGQIDAAELVSRLRKDVANKRRNRPISDPERTFGLYDPQKRGD